MSRPLHAVGALMRWRAFGESRAREAFARQSHETQQATTQADEARGALDAVAEQRLGLLQETAVDLGLLDVARAIEQAADDELRTREQALSDARTRHAAAQQRYVAARAQTRVAEERGRRMTHAANEQREKRLFDWMADMHAARRRTP